MHGRGGPCLRCWETLPEFLTERSVGQSDVNRLIGTDHSIPCSMSLTARVSLSSPNTMAPPADNITLQHQSKADRKPIGSKHRGVDSSKFLAQLRAIFSLCEPLPLVRLQLFNRDFRSMFMRIGFWTCEGRGAKMSLTDQFLEVNFETAPCRVSRARGPNFRHSPQTSSGNVESHPEHAEAANWIVAGPPSLYRIFQGIGLHAWPVIAHRDLGRLRINSCQTYVNFGALDRILRTFAAYSPT